MQQVTATQSTRPARSPMDLDVGRLTMREAAQLGGLAVASLAVATLGGLLARLTLPTSFDELAGWRFVLFGFGLALLVVAFGFGVVVCGLTVADWHGYLVRKADWHDATLRAYTALDGVETDQSLSITDFSPSVPLHVLAAALVTHRRVLAGADSPFSVRQLAGPVFLDAVRIGDVSGSAAEELPRVFASLGLVKGRGPGRAGEWVPTTEAEVIAAIAKNWGKVK